jgi:hypothetical protein
MEAALARQGIRQCAAGRHTPHCPPQCGQAHRFGGYLARIGENNLPTLAVGAFAYMPGRRP